MLDGLLEVGLEWDTQDNYLWIEHLDHCIQELALMFAHVQKSNSWNHNSNKRCTISVLLCVTQFFRLVECRTICKKNQCCFYKHLLQFIIANNTLYFTANKSWISHLSRYPAVIVNRYWIVKDRIWSSPNLKYSLWVYPRHQQCCISYNYCNHVQYDNCWQVWITFQL